MRPAPAGRKKEAGGPLLTAQTGGAIVPNGQRKLRWADARRGKGRIADYLLSLSVRSSDLVDDSLQQRRGFGPDSATEKGVEDCDCNGIGGTGREGARPAV